jgi:hypothetical protein
MPMMTAIENTRLDNMEQKLTTVEGKVDRILVALTGDELNEKGLISQFNSLKERVEKLESLKTKIIYLGTGAGVACGFFVKDIWDWFHNIIKVI